MASTKQLVKDLERRTDASSETLEQDLAAAAAVLARGDLTARDRKYAVMVRDRWQAVLDARPR